MVTGADARLRSRWSAAAAASPRAAAVLEWLGQRPGPVLLGLGALLGALVQPLAAGGDARWIGLAGDRLLSPDGIDVFDDPGLQVGPTYLLLVGALRAGARALGLSVWSVTGAVLSVLVVGGVLLALRWAGSGLVARWAVGLPLIVGGALSEALMSGHPEELGVGVLLVLAALAARRGSVVLAPLLVGLAASSKLWGVIGVALLLMALPAGRAGIRALATRAAVVTAVGAIAYVPFFVAGDVRTFGFVWAVDPYSAVGMLTGLSGVAPFSLRLVQVVLSVGLGLLLLRRGAEPAVVVLGMVATRLLTDPLALDYYFAALVLLVLLAAWSGTRVAGGTVRLVAVVLVPVEVLGAYAVPDPALGVLHLGLLAAVLVGCLRASRPRRADLPGQDPGRIDVP